jgi:O-antigen ligase
LTTLAVPRRVRLGGPVPFSILAFCGWAGLLAATIPAMTVLGLWAVMLPVYAFGLLVSALRPQLAAYLLLITAIVIEPGAVDWTKPLSAALWQMPPKFENLVQFTTSPLELFVLVAAASALLTRPSQVKLPALAWAVPVVIVLGFAYGLSKGGASNLGYNEARGLLIGVAVFVLAARVFPRDTQMLIKPVLVAVTLLALSIIARYLIYVRGNRLDVSMEYAFSHEGSVILGVGMVVSAVSIFRTGATNPQRVLSAICCLIILAAMLASGRRAATLVLVVGAGTLGLVMLPRRPKLVIMIAIPVLLATGAYLGAYWNKEYGAMAQPARAIRSQFDPSLRDESSDQYRTIEKYDVIETIRVNRPFGVGFGRPFVQFWPLPNLQHMWSLQNYTPHQNVLWLWLKMGIVGISVILGFATLAMSRCMDEMKEAATEEEWAVPVICLTVLVMFLMYSTVDLGFIGPRSVAPAAVACAVAFSFAKRREATNERS